MPTSSSKEHPMVTVLAALLGTDGPSREAYVEWAYGQTKLESNDVTREMAEAAVARKLDP